MTAERKSSGSVSEPVEAERMGMPLCVDLDGTLVRSDLLVEAFFGLVRADILAALKAPLWLMHGKARLKAETARRVNLDVTTLPYNERLLAYLRGQRAQGRYLVLATASPEKYAQQVAKHLRLFDEVIATRTNINLSGDNKAEALVKRFGEEKFDYAGNGRSDLAVWKRAHRAILVDPEPGVASAVRDVIEVESLIETGMWLGAHRGKLHDDPVIFALKDHVSRWVILVTGIIIITATYAP
jgi:phosphoserine phosphatase